MLPTKVLIRNFKCEILAKSTTLNNLQLWLSLLPSADKLFYLGLPVKQKRFTLLKSPLGNKQAKDQYQLYEYSCYVRLKNNNPYIVLSFLDLMKKSIGVKLKITLFYSYK